MKVVVWNMNFKRAHGNWSKFRDDGELACDIALLNEATPPPPELRKRVWTRGKTVGRDDVTHGGKKTRDWATAVFSPHPFEPPKDVWALSAEYFDRRTKMNVPRNDRRSKLKVSRPGSWAAAVVSFPNGERWTAISLYGLMDERSDASVHRSLSDLTPLFEDERYNELLLLGGDLNTLCTAEAGSPALARDQGVIDRIVNGFGLKDLLLESIGVHEPDRQRLEVCKCSLGAECRHTATYRKSKGAKARYQDDYLFASRALADRLERCIALEFTPDWSSDHVPIVATFR